MRRRVAVFQALSQFQSPTANCVSLLADAGYAVDLFLADIPYYMVDLAQIGEIPGVRIHDLSPPPSRRVIVGGGRRLRRATRRLWAAPLDGRRAASAVVPADAVSNAIEITRDRPYVCFVGVEKRGLIWASLVAESCGVPVAYYSLELYTDEVWRSITPRPADLDEMRAAERYYHARAAATIVQDQRRAEVLLKDNGIPPGSTTVLHVPVSLTGEPVEQRGSYLRDRLGIPPDQKIVLYLGMITADRYCLDLVEAAQAFPDGWMLVMHGWGAPSVIEEVRRRDLRERVTLSLDLIGSNDLGTVVSSADVGLALYRPAPQNDRLTAFSSEKVAWYTKSGVPFVAFDYPGYRQLAEEDRCAATISSIGELPGAIRRILESIDSYRDNARRAFTRYYQSERAFQPVLRWVECLTSEKPVDRQAVSVPGP